MKENEIKEILNLFKDKNVNGFIISDKMYQNLKDYITNLQHENEELKKEISFLYNLEHNKDFAEFIKGFCNE